jgi:hypothetical protein
MEVPEMAMRSQVYEWDASRAAAGGVNTAVPAANTTLGPFSIFIGGNGNNITKPAETTATQFVVIEDIGVSGTEYVPNAIAGAIPYRGLRMLATNNACGTRSYIQVRINTTDYFLDPDGVGNDGVPGTAAPYPRNSWRQPSFNLYPDVYVLPGQVWDLRVTSFSGAAGFTNAAAALTVAGDLQAFCKYTLYDGPDALIANKLLEMGVSVNPGNVDWYKRTLISGSAAVATV